MNHAPACNLFSLNGVSSDMAYDPNNHSRRSVRMRGYDYAGPGAYFVTLCVRQRECLLGEIVRTDSVGAHGRAPRSSAIARGMSLAMVSGLTGNVCMKLSGFGTIVQDEWRRSVFIRPEIELDAFVVMPNHVHGIIIITEMRAHGRAPLQPDWFNRKPRSLGSFIAGFKSTTTKRINIIRGTPGVPVWQRNYYERVIRNEAELNAIRQYIADNPRQWDWDRENPLHR